MEHLSEETLASLTLIGTPILMFVGSLYITRSPKREQPEVDLEAFIANAPYHYLDQEPAVQDQNLGPATFPKCGERIQLGGPETE